MLDLAQLSVDDMLELHDVLDAFEDAEHRAELRAQEAREARR